LIRNVVFDIGGVLVRLRYQGFVQYLVDAGIDMTNLPAWLAQVDLEAHERGEMAGAMLLDRIAAMAPRRLEPAELQERWLDMFERWDEMCELAAGLMGNYRVYLLSNIGDLHWTHLDARYGIGSLVHGACASYQVGAIKPTAEIYRKAESMFGLEPAATVFIDDLPPNVAGARACGWHAIHHQGVPTTRVALQALGVRVPVPVAQEP
jgi:FMN phosphatase YigB (HAD superfamily)